MDFASGSSLGFYGPVTATLDWCEANYQFSYYVAEMANSVSNLFTIYLAIHAAMKVIQERLPYRFLIGCIGFAFVGVGSMAFHATLLYEAQLMDELPMVYVASMSLWLLYDYQQGFDLRSFRTKNHVAALLLFDVLFTWSYSLYRNPVYHQMVFAILVISCALRIAYLLKASPVRDRVPPNKKKSIARVFFTGAFTFAFGFLVWNLDNIFCDFLSGLKGLVGYPLAFCLEGHSWWHILTGLGTYYMFVGIQCETYTSSFSYIQSLLYMSFLPLDIALCIKDDHRKYTIAHTYSLPHIKRVDN
uniref:Alkaline phytoceramidase n=1 Tax=Moniliophthora roreri TaxID=221103 RepID=A0A0W0F1J5_MONRR